VRTDKKILRQAQLVRSQYLVGNCQHFLRTVYFLIRRITLATDRNSNGCTPAGSTACTACKPFICSGIAFPVISWIKAPKLVSSCGGLPTTVNDQIGSRR